MRHFVALCRGVSTYTYQTIMLGLSYLCWIAAHDKSISVVWANTRIGFAIGFFVIFILHLYIAGSNELGDEEWRRIQS